MPDLPWFVYAWPLLMIGMVAGAVFYKWLQVRQAASWPQTTGKVVVSTSERRTVETFDDNREGGKSQEVRNFAKIVYEYQVSGQKLRASRVSIGEDLGNFMVEETIARYPVGRVVTVYYNPRRPKDAVLERELLFDPPPGAAAGGTEAKAQWRPKNMFGCAVWGIVIALVAVYGSFYGFNQITIALTERVNNAPMVVALTAMGLVTLFFGFVLRRQGSDAQGWPQVQGRIVKSEVEAFRGHLSNDSSLTTLHRPQIAYSYDYKGVTYRGTQTSFGMKVTSAGDGYAKKLVAQYPPGKVVTVHVNPQNASESTLSTSVSGAWLIWAIAAGLLGLAFFVSRQP